MTAGATLLPTTFIDSDSDVVRDFAARHAGTGGERDRAVRLYHAVRDGIRYDPYTIRLEEEDFRASTCLEARSAFCVPKAVALAAVARAAGIPSRLGFADVRNHITSPRLSAMMDTDLFVWHGYTSLFIDGRWVKATPAFDIELCRKRGVTPLDFDGREDSILHPFDAAGRRHMEYLRQRGEYDDMPFAEFAAGLRATYPKFLAALQARRDARSQFADEAG